MNISTANPSIMRMWATLLVLTLSTSLLSACGWRLRGSEQGLDIDQAIYLAPASGRIYDQIQKSITRKQPAVDIAEADIQLLLGDEVFTRRSSSVNNDLQTIQYELRLYISYEIVDAVGKPLAKKATAELSRFYNFNQNAITSSDKEEQSLRREMVRQVSRQILTRVRFLSKKQAQESTL